MILPATLSTVNALFHGRERASRSQSGARPSVAWRPSACCRRMADHQLHLALGIPDQHPDRADRAGRHAALGSRDQGTSMSSAGGLPGGRALDRRTGWHRLRPDRGPALRLVVSSRAAHDRRLQLDLVDLAGARLIHPRPAPDDDFRVRRAGKGTRWQTGAARPVTPGIRSFRYGAIAR